MNTEMRHKLEALLSAPLSQSELDLVSVISLPKSGDRLLRLRTLEDILQDFDDTDGEDDSFVVWIKRRKEPSPTHRTTSGPEALQRPMLDGLYLPSGKLNTQFLIQNAEILYQSGDYALARNIYKTLLAAGEKTAIAHFGLGRCHQSEGRTDEAIAAYEESLTYHPTQVGYRRLISLLVTVGRHAQAAEVATKALVMRDLTPAVRAELHKAAGNCLARLNRSAEAEQHYLQAIDAQPTADDVRANLGALYLQSQRISDAKKQFQDALAANPRNAKAHEGLGSCHVAEGEKRLAHDAFLTSLQVELKNANALFHLIRCAYELKSYAAAADIAERYIEIGPVNANLLYSVAGLHFHLGKLNEARTAAQRVIDIQPNHHGAAELLQMIQRMSPESAPTEAIWEQT